MRLYSKSKTFNRRLNLLIIITYLIGALIGGRLFIITVIRHDFYLSKENIQKRFAEAQAVRRGEIYLIDKQGELFPAAVNKAWPMAYIEPKKLQKQNKKALSQTLAQILQLDGQKILKKLSDPHDPFEILKHKLTPEEAQAIKKLDIAGVGYKLEKNLRYYPAQTLASHALGFLGYQGNERKGQYGVEEYYNNLLSNRSPQSNSASYLAKPAQKKNLVLTIDPNIQLFVEENLKKTVEKYQASGGTVIVMDPTTGKILAMANYPNFNPNEYAKVNNLNLFINKAVSEIFEPGSVFKPFIMAIALDQGIVTPSSTFDDKGFVKIGGYKIENAEKKAFGIQTMTQVLEKSLNTGIVYVERLLKKETIKRYLRNFGFGEKTGIDLPGEAKGTLSNLNSGRDINFATAAFGQGISVTPMQIVRALSIIANGGRMIRPHVLEGIEQDGIIKHKAFKSLEQVIAPETAHRLTAMLVSVTENGTGRKAKIPNYWIATKTGTAQIPFRHKRGYSNDTIQTVIGFAPAYNARFVVLATLYRPHGARFAASSVAPLFKNIVNYILNYLEIPPER